ncbi:MAG: Serine/threonine-protein phosphatase 1 [Candidatus Celerinatantimonas neptuna]|nr:MAG: Serine/threonine-protein phosphatase 1 [Candidatus Celerinatantimonas neptuna]
MIRKEKLSIRRWHQVLSVSQSTRLFVVGDIHANFQPLQKKLAQIQFNQHDILLCCGDLIDRGPQSLECLEWCLNSPNIYSVLGNHEDMAIRARLEHSSFWLKNWVFNGGSWHHSVNSEKLNTILQKTASTLPILMTVHHQAHTIGLCHGEFDHSLWQPIAEQAQINSFEHIEKLLWGRSCLQNKRAPAVIDIDLIIHGHTPTKTPIRLANQYWIDTGFISGLTIAEIQAGQLILN